MNRLHLGYTWHGDQPTWSKRLAVITSRDIVVLNPSNGPKPDDDTELQNLRHLVSEVRDRHASAFGYVDTDYGRRSFLDVISDISAWATLYNVRAIFFDQVQSDLTSKLAVWYQCLCRQRRVEASYSQINCILNVGTATKAEMPWGALAVTYEGPQGSYPSKTWGPREASIVYGSSDRMAGGPTWQAWTADVMPNPYDEVS